LSDRSALGRFLLTCRRFGLLVAVNVARSKLRGWLFPATALPDRPPRAQRARDLAILLDAAEHAADDLDGIIGAIAGSASSSWEICICERRPVSPDIAQALARWRGRHAWLRIVSSDPEIDAVTAARLTLEQATGRFVALVAPGYAVGSEALAALLARLREEPEQRAAALGTGVRHHRHPPRRRLAAGCRLLMLRKADYLLLPKMAGLLSARTVAAHLDEAILATEPRADDVARLSTLGPEARDLGHCVDRDSGHSRSAEPAT
jgi:hypothetical protein